MRRVATMAVLVLMLACSGCTGIAVSRGGTRGLLPEIPVPARPVLQEMTPEETAQVKALPASVVAKVQANIQELQKYATKLNVSIEEYNIYAKVNNRLAREELGIKPKQEPETKP